MAGIETKKFGKRAVVSTGRKWEDIVGYSRAVRIGNQIAVTGTIGMDAKGVIPDDAAEQMRLALETIRDCMVALGADMTDIIRTRIFVTDISQWKEIGTVHNEFFSDVRPATTMVEVSALVDPTALVEVEADAVLTA